jgi:hypothetical protein
MVTVKQSPLLEFTSSAFAVEPGEDEHTNPGIFGKALASWIAQQLRAQGTAAGKIVAEDFGWCVPIESKPHRLYVACASIDDEQDHWGVFAFVEGGLLTRAFGKDVSDQAIEALFATLKEVLQKAPEVQKLRETAS